MGTAITDNQGAAAKSGKAEVRLRLSRLVNSPVLFALLAVLTVGLLVRMALITDAATRAPRLPDWNWSRHSQAMLICYRPGCGCTPNVVAQALGTASSHHMDALVLTDLPRKQAASGTGLPVGAAILKQVSRADLQHLNPTGTTVLVRVEGGRIRRRIEAAFLGPDFFQ